MKPFTDLDLAKAFHGHLGPNLVIGMKMGNHAVLALSPHCCFEMRSKVHCPTEPPLSCVIDGIQLSTGCTMGKANIRHFVAANVVSATFTNTATGRSVTLRVHADFIARTLKWRDEQGEEKASQMTWEAEDHVVFSCVSGPG